MSLEGTTHSACPGTTFDMAEASGGNPKDPGKEPESPKAPEPSTLSGDKEESSEGHFRDGKWYQKEDSGFQNPASAETRGQGTPERVGRTDDQAMDTTPATDAKASEPPVVQSAKKDSGTPVSASEKEGEGARSSSPALDLSESSSKKGKRKKAPEVFHATYTTYAGKPIPQWIVDGFEKTILPSLMKGVPTPEERCESYYDVWGAHGTKRTDNPVNRAVSVNFIPFQCCPVVGCHFGPSRGRHVTQQQDGLEEGRVP